MWVKENSKSRLTKIPINNHQPRINTTPIVQKLIQTKKINLHCHQPAKHVDLDGRFLTEKKDRVRPKKSSTTLHQITNTLEQSTYVDWFERERERERMNWIKVDFFNSNEQYYTLVNTNEVLFICYIFVLVWDGWCIAQLCGFKAAFIFAKNGFGKTIYTLLCVWLLKVQYVYNTPLNV